MDVAAGNGHLELVKWLHEHEKEGCTKHAIDSAAGNGHLEVVKFLHENRTEGCSQIASLVAAMNGNLEMLKYLHENGLSLPLDSLLPTAAGMERLEIIKYIHENGPEHDTGGWLSCWGVAVSERKEGVIKFMLENRRTACNIKEGGDYVRGFLNEYLNEE